MPGGAVQVAWVEILIGLYLSRQRPQSVIGYGGIHIVADVYFCTAEAKYNYKEKNQPLLTF